MNLLDIINKAKAEKATSLDLSQKELRILPQELFELEDLEELILDRNMLVELPDDISKPPVPGLQQPVRTSGFRGQSQKAPDGEHRQEPAFGSDPRSRQVDKRYQALPS